MTQPDANTLAIRLSVNIVGLWILGAVQVALHWKSLCWTSYVGMGVSFLLLGIGIIATRMRHPRLLRLYAGVQIVLVVLALLALVGFSIMAIEYYSNHTFSWEQIKTYFNYGVISPVVSALFIFVLVVRSICLSRKLASQIVLEQAQAEQEIELASTSATPEPEVAQQQQPVVFMPHQPFQHTYVPVPQQNVQLVPVYVDQYGNPLVQVHQ